MRINFDGKREVIGVRQVQGESQRAWEGFLHNLHRRGLEDEGLKLIAIDGGKGLDAALHLVHGDVLFSAVGLIRPEMS